MADDDAAASTRATTSIEENLQDGKNATGISRKKTLESGGWFTATHHNSRLIAFSETGAEAVDKSTARSSPARFTTTASRRVALLPLSIISGKFAIYASILGIWQTYARHLTPLSARIAPSHSSRTDTPASPDVRYARKRTPRGRSVQGTPPEIEAPRGENKRAERHRSPRNRPTLPDSEKLVQQGLHFHIQVQIGIKTKLKSEIGVQDQTGSRNQKEAAEEAHNQEGR
ncbi:hypothetical protein HPB52_021575 [Rhipicephalus sanguineus]|uniref:Uncharacterized protein n=1 Tax=Rhipicephalus sanguineus TaxID=34632 RepID=A0A9D4Q896_RHISA|nr:hypothetical protein HPB52_021575 [Rhipicephalus sanguineus]